MIKHSLKKTWKNKRKSRILLFEFFLSFVLLFALISLIGKFLYNNKAPLGFTYQHVWSGIIEPQVELSDSAILSIKKEIFQRINNYPEIFLLSELHHNQPFVRNSTYVNYFKHNDIVVSKNYAFGADDHFAEVMGLNIIEGRWYDERDNSSRYRPIVINNTLRNKLGNDVPVLGAIVDFHHNTEKCKVVGIVEDFRYKGDYSSKRNEVFFRCSLIKNPNYNHVDAYGSYNANSSSVHDKRIYLKVKPGSDLSLEAKLLDDLNQHFPNWKFKFITMEEQRTQYLNRFWFPVVLLISVSLFLIFNVAIGLFAVLWYNINHRKAEIGIRIANGATKGHIYAHFIIELLWLSTLGIIPGLIIAIQFPVLKVFNLESNLYILAMLAAVLIIYLLVAISAIIPSRQAAKIQPATALHEE